jgi:hypothetical protein
MTAGLARRLARKLGLACVCCHRLTGKFIRYGTWLRGISFPLCEGCRTGCRTEVTH